MRYWLPYVTIEHEDEDIVGSEPDEQQAELVEQYKRYFETIKASLPPDLLLFTDKESRTMSLNDGEVRAIHSDFGSKRVTIVIQGEAHDQDWLDIGGRLFTLHYIDVADWDYKGKETGLAGLDGDHLFDEVQIADGLIQHRMYFSGQIEITVRFSDFSLEYEDTPYEPHP